MPISADNIGWSSVLMVDVCVSSNQEWSSLEDHCLVVVTSLLLATSPVPYTSATKKTCSFLEILVAFLHVVFNRERWLLGNERNRRITPK